MVRLVTGGTGFIGRHLLRELTKRDGTTYVLVRPASRARLEALIESLGAAKRLRPLAGHIIAPSLGIAAADQATRFRRAWASSAKRCTRWRRERCSSS